MDATRRKRVRVTNWTRTCRTSWKRSSKSMALQLLWSNSKSNPPIPEALLLTQTTQPPLSHSKSMGSASSSSQSWHPNSSSRHLPSKKAWARSTCHLVASQVTCRGAVERTSRLPRRKKRTRRTRWVTKKWSRPMRRIRTMRLQMGTLVVLLREERSSKRPRIDYKRWDATSSTECTKYTILAKTETGLVQETLLRESVWYHWTIWVKMK